MKQISNRWAISKYCEGADGGQMPTIWDQSETARERIVHLYPDSSSENIWFRERGEMLIFMSQMMQSRFCNKCAHLKNLPNDIFYSNSCLKAEMKLSQSRRCPSTEGPARLYVIRWNKRQHNFPSSFPHTRACFGSRRGILCSPEPSLDHSLNMSTCWVSIMCIDDRIDGVEIA